MGIPPSTSVPGPASPEMHAQYRACWKQPVRSAPQSSLRDPVKASTSARAASSLHLPISVKQVETQPPFGVRNFLPRSRRGSVVGGTSIYLFVLPGFPGRNQLRAVGLVHGNLLLGFS